MLKLKDAKVIASLITRLENAEYEYKQLVHTISKFDVERPVRVSVNSFASMDMPPHLLLEPMYRYYVGLHRKLRDMDVAVGNPITRIHHYEDETYKD